MKFSAQGRKVFKDAVQTSKDGNKSTYSLGYPVLEICDYVNNADEMAKIVAEIMSESDRLE